MKQFWLFKTEPETYSIDDLAKERKTEWYGIRNYQARNMLRDAVLPKDGVLIYHSNAKEIGIVGLAEVVGGAFPDTAQFDPKSPYYDAKSKKEKPTWVSRDVAFVRKFPRTILLSELREHKELENMRVLQKGNRLSITPVTIQEFEYVLTLAKKKK